MRKVQWVMAAGGTWVPLDTRTSRQLEAWWSTHTGGYLRIPAFGASPVYVDTSQLSVHYGGNRYVIARRLY
ncbi:hypothetical protein INT43_007120 [Umbelopsis isabellina]|uniref:Uncharacterized protein n=1 Tax=Mortierella isabellina TaxID=91625 RepID=A0A8H7PXR0_MORIS|nr:hypothetical protein INT43_007120 [Umbelopsis isabellina]